MVGELTPPVEPRRRPDGSKVLTFRVAVRTPTAGGGRGAAPASPRGLGPTGRRDILDCVVGPATVRRRLEACLPGDVIELSGPLRHRFWNTAGRVQSRYEIEVVTLRRLARDRSRQPKP